MKTAAIYCRVSGEAQEREGTSLDSQRGADLAKGKELGYNTPGTFVLSEVGSRLTLDRPKLNQLRQWVRDKQIDAVIVYVLDRLSGDPVHEIILEDEMERHGVQLISVTENVDSSDLGKLVSYIRGYTAKVEVEKIRERTMRGKRTRALAGKLPANSHAKLYGYTYIRGKGLGEGIRYVNEEEAKWVREMYCWLVEERLSTDAITYRLRDLKVPTPSGKGFWIRSTVQKILKNIAYTGKTYAFTCTYGEPRFRVKPDTKRKNTGIIWKPKEEWIEIPNATPVIISQELFDAAQERLKENHRMATRNSKNEYLLHGHIYCARCGRVFWGAPGIKPRNGKRYCYPFYQCSGRLKKVTPVRCDNRQHNAKRLENLVWQEVDKVLNQPELVLSELEKRETEQNTNIWQKDLERLTTQLENREHQKERVWKAFEITGDEAAFRKDISAIEKNIKEFQIEKAKLEQRIESNKQLELNRDNLKTACELVSSNLKKLDYSERRLALQALQIKVLVDGDCITIQEAIPVEVGYTATTASGWRHPARHRGS